MRVAEGISCRYHGHDVRIAANFRESGDDLLILLHGIGCSKESFDHAFDMESLYGFSICAFDFPGHGESSKDLPYDFYTLPALADITERVVGQLVSRRAAGYRRVCIAGHSMGGAVGVLVAEGSPDIDVMVSIDGNLIGEDCGLVSRSIAEQSTVDFRDTGFANFLAKLRKSEQSDLLAWAQWCAGAEPAAMHEAARSLVEWSDSRKLLEQFNELAGKAYLYGAQDDRDYLIPQLASALIDTVPGSSHFMMVDNPDSLYEKLSRALSANEQCRELAGVSTGG
jgi:pimeloyl-ACP methyl ester carboxylesterase